MVQDAAELSETFARARRRVDYVLIWGHGLDHEVGILDMLFDDSGFTPLHVLRYRPTDIRKLVRAIYSYDYAPFHHLESKTRYLTKTRPEVLFVFMENLAPQEYASGNGAFRHLECARIKALKTRIRERFNPRRADGKMPSEDHVIHASDNAAQSEHILRWLGRSGGVASLKPHAFPFFAVRPHLPVPAHVDIHRVSLADLRCNILEGDRWDYQTREVGIEESPHFRALEQGDPATYATYLDRFRGTGLRDPYTVKRYLSLAGRLDYLAPPYQTGYVLLRKSGDGGFRVVDGLHRAAILCHRGEATILGAIMR